MVPAMAGLRVSWDWLVRLSGIVSVLAGSATLLPRTAAAAVNVFLTDVPDYHWAWGCFGTATGNLFGYWDRHGFPDYYTGPTGGGLAPLNSIGTNSGIQSLWASKAGVDGRPTGQPGHLDDYWVGYESTAQDPFVSAGRAEHVPDCTGDFIGLSQRKWSDLGGECSGNIDAYSFNFFEPGGAPRLNFTPPPLGGQPVPDIQSGLRAWSVHRGYAAETLSQLSDFNPHVVPGAGFTFEDLKAEIEAGYPVLLFMQPFDEFSRKLGGTAGLNPNIHGMLAYGYVEDDADGRFVRFRSSWGDGDFQFAPWTDENWTPGGSLNFPLRGVICFRPQPKFLPPERVGDSFRFRWHGPAGVLRDELAETETPVHRYVVEKSPTLAESGFVPVAETTEARQLTVPLGGEAAAFFRVRLVTGRE